MEVSKKKKKKKAAVPIAQSTLKTDPVVAPKKPRKPLAHKIAAYSDAELDQYLEKNGR